MIKLIQNSAKVLISLSVVASFVGLSVAGVFAQQPVAISFRSYNIELLDIEGLVCEEAVKNLYTMSVINGYAGDLFLPEEPATRGQVATMVANSFNLNMKVDQAGWFQVDFSDSIDGPHREDILTVQRLGIVNGFSDGTFKQDEPVTRGEITKILHNAFISERIEPEVLVSNFPDVEGNSPFYEFIAYMQNVGVINGYSDNLFRPNNNVTRCELALILDRAISTATRLKADESHSPRFINTKYVPCRESLAELSEEYDLADVAAFHKTPAGVTSVEEFNILVAKLFPEIEGLEIAAQDKLTEEQMKATMYKILRTQQGSAVPTLSFDINGEISESEEIELDKIFKDFGVQYQYSGFPVHCEAIIALEQVRVEI